VAEDWRCHYNRVASVPAAPEFEMLVMPARTGGTNAAPKLTFQTGHLIGDCQQAITLAIRGKTLGNRHA
jgi:hypothetical protein